MLGLLIASLLTVLATLIFLWYRNPENYPPGKRGVPILGVIPFLEKNPAKSFDQWSKRYGPIMSYRLGSKSLIVVNDYDIVYEATVKTNNFTERFSTDLFDLASCGLGITFAHGDLWKVQRSFGEIQLKKFGMEKKKAEKTIMEQVQRLVESIKNKNGEMLNLKDMLFYSMANITCSMIFGKKFKENDQTFREILYRTTASLEDPDDTPLLLSINIWTTFRFFSPFRGAYRRFVENLEISISEYKKIIDEHMQTFEENNLRDFTDAFILAMKNHKHESFNEKQLAHYLHDLLEAGSRTSSTILLWCILCMANYPEYEEKLLEEIHRVLGHNGQVQMAHRNEMSYVNAFIHEILRIKAVLTVIHYGAVEDTVIRGYRIPKNTAFVVNIWSIHRNEKYFKNPETFLPERFIDPETGKFVPSPYWMPFGIGRRSCLGKQMAMMELFLCLVNIIQNFKIMPSKTGDKLPKFEENIYGILVNCPSFDVRLKHRTD